MRRSCFLRYSRICYSFPSEFNSPSLYISSSIAFSSTYRLLFASIFSPHSFRRSSCFLAIRSILLCYLFYVCSKLCTLSLSLFLDLRVYENMGLKSLISLQMIPLCFYVAKTSNQSTNTKMSAARAARLITSDGRLRVYERRVSAAELMREHPCHLVCRSDAFVIGQKIPALSPSDRLQPGRSYLLLPAHLFHSVLSFLSLAALCTTQNNAKSSPLRRFDIHRTEKGTLQIRFSEELQQVERTRGGSKQEVMVGRRICTTEELDKDYMNLVRSSSKRWRPKLERVEESEKRRRRFGVLNRRRRKREQTSETDSRL